jgi:hypothetical protein
MKKRSFTLLDIFRECLIFSVVFLSFLTQRITMGAQHGCRHHLKGIYVVALGKARSVLGKDGKGWIFSAPVDVRNGVLMGFNGV